MTNEEKRKLITELQSQGLQLVNQDTGASGRKGGAGPSDHKAVTVDGTTVMIPVYNGVAAESPYTTVETRQGIQAFEETSKDSPSNFASLQKNGKTIASLDFPNQPKFYNLKTAEGIPYNQIALLHSHNVLATTVLQTCIRYSNRNTSCQFCAIGQSLEAGKTIAQKLPEQLAEVAAAAVELDGIEHLVMTTGTPNTTDRGAAYLAQCAQAVKARVNLPIQAQCEPPNDFVWFTKMKEAGVDSLGMHLEVIEPAVRDRIMPGKAKVSLDYYFEAFAAAVKVFGWGQVSTYILAGLGDSLETIINTCDRLIQIGVYPFVVPFVPITGTPLANHQPPSSEFMYAIYEKVGAMLNNAGMSSEDIKAGCAKCGACSALSVFENINDR
ncbi:Radical SAM protein, MSMEG_0568 family [Hyella patelloides LEGE 07179]|uniref:Radical SAM protein, MSMEG_0568 family n=1 Tax=Hyella patelloides LEGE 07179 TaxID=945734 RepID=A0A563W3H0_9CYAN|nr:MSMEG_0568 family radical SAM protein [Hyella patelloides]VEP18190.1 Radical SAM protein, MSMEG_0568 family [Hyella patelloides LEGE 07179]